MDILKGSIILFVILIASATSSNENEALKSFIRARLQKYKSEVERVHGLAQAQASFDSNETEPLSSSQARFKRTVIPPFSQSGRRRRNITDFDFDGTNVVTRTFQLTPQRFDDKLLYDLNVIQIKSEFHAFTLEKSASADDVETVVYKLQNLNDLQELVRVSTPDAASIEVSQINSQFYVFPIKPVRQLGDHGSDLYIFDSESHGLQKVQTIQTPNAQISHFWMGSGQEANDAFLAIAPDHVVTSNGQIQYKVQIPVYMWQGGYFDLVYSLTGSNPQSIQHASITSQEYLAIANYQDAPKSTSIFSEILRYSYKESKFASFQRVLTHGAKDIKFFSFENGQRGESFLAIANECEYNERGTVNYNVKSQILKLASETFIPFQSIATNGAFQILPVKSGKLFMLVLGEINQFRVVQYNGFRFVETFRKSFSESDTLPNFIRLRSLVFDSRPFFALASSDTSKVASGLFGFEFEEKNHLRTMRKEFFEWCAAAVTKVEAAGVATLKEGFENAPKTTDKEIVLESDITFHHVTVDLLQAKSMTHGDRTFDVELSHQLAATEQELTAVAEKILDIQVKLGQVLLKNAKQDVSAEVHFANVEHSGARIQTVDVTTDKLNQFDVKQLLANLIFLDKDHSFRKVTAEHITSSHADFFNRLNGHSYSEYAQRTSQSVQKFQQNNKFLADVRVQKAIKVDGFFDDVNFNDITFLTSKGNQTFSSAINAANSQVLNLYSRKVNDVDLEFYMEEAVPRLGDTVITGAKEFQAASVHRLQANKISEVDIDKLYAESIYLGAGRNPEFSSVTLSFDHLSTKNVRLSTSTLNDKYKIDDLVIINEGTYNFDSIELLQDAVIHDLQITSFLNSIRATEDGLNLVLKNSQVTQVISKKDYSQINLERDASADGDINGINFREWSAEKVIELKSSSLSFRNLHIDGDITVAPGINFETGRSARFQLGSNDVTRLLAKSLLLNATKLPSTFRGTIKFESVSVNEDTQVGLINRMSPAEWLTRNSGSEKAVAIQGEKTFTGTLELRSPATTNEFFSSKDRSAINILTQMNDFLLDGVDQTVSRTTKFKERVTIDNLNCPNVNLNGVLFKDLILVRGNQHVSGKAVFEKVVEVLKNFGVDGDMEVHKISIHGDYHSLNGLIEDALLLSSPTPQIVTGVYEFASGFTTQSLTTLDEFEGGGISALLSSTVRKDAPGPHNIQGSLIFNNAADIERIEFTGHMNGIPHTEWGEGFLLSSGHQVITTPVKFLNGLQASSVEVNDEKISNINFVKLADDVLRVDDHGSLGFVDFTGIVETTNGVSLRPETKVNGYNIFTDLLLNGAQNGHQIITGSKTFEKAVKIQGNLNVKTLEGFGYDQAVKFVNPTIQLREDNLHIAGDLTLHHEPKFVSHINGHEWSTLTEDVWWTHKPAIIRSHYKFKELTFEAEVLHIGKLNDFDLEELDRTYLSKTKDQAIGATEVTFESGLSVKSLDVRKIEMPNGGLFNRVSLKEFSESVFLNGKAQIIPQSLEFEELEVDEIEMDDGVRVGGLDLSTEALTLNGENVITGKKTIESLTVRELQLGDSTKLNGIDLREWSKKAVTRIGDFTINGDVRIQDATFALDVKVHKLVDGQDFNRQNIFTLSGDQTITGKITFVNDLRTSSEGIETDLFNGKNLTELVDSFVMADEHESGPLVITGEKTFTRVLNTESIRSEGLVMNENLTEVFKDLKPETHIDVDSFMNLNLSADYDKLIEEAERLVAHSDKQAVFLDYYEFTHKVAAENVVNFKPLILHDSKSVGLGLVTATPGGLFASGAHSFSFMMHNSTTNSYFASSLSSVNVNGILQDFVEVHNGQEYFIAMTIASTKEVTLNVESEEDLEEKQSAGPEGLSKTVLLTLKEQPDGSKKWVVRQTLTGHRFGPITSFKISNSNGKVNCLLVVDYGSTDSEEQAQGFVYSFNDAASTQSVAMTLLQQIPLERPSQIGSVEINSTTLLFMGIRGSSDLKGHGEVVHAWSYNSKSNSFKEIDCLPIVNLVSLSTISGPNHNAFVALASGQVNEDSGSVYIYKFLQDSQKFVKVLSIPVDQPKQVHFQLIYSEAFLYVLNSAPVHNVAVYSFKGKMGWVKEHRFTSSNAQILRTSGFKLGNDLTSEVLIAGQNDVSVFTGLFHGNKNNYMRISAQDEKPAQRRGKRFLLANSTRVELPGLKTTSPGLRLMSAFLGTLFKPKPLN